MLNSNQQKKGSTLFELLKTSLPAVLDLSIQPLLWTYEAILIGRLGAAALGGHGLAVQVIIVVFTVLLTFIVGSSLIINWHLGKKDNWEANHIFGQSMMIGVFMSVFFAAAFYFGSPLLFSIIKDTEVAAKAAGVQYLGTLAWFMPVIVVNFVALGIIRGVGDAHLSLMVNITMSVVNFMIAPLLIFGRLGLPRMEVAGAATAVGTAHFIGLCMTVWILRSKRCKLFLSFREVTTPKLESLKLLFSKGLPTTIEQLSWAMGQLMVSIWVARLGVVALATHQILIRINAVLSMVYQGFGLGSMAIVGKKFGASELHSALRTGLVAGRTVFLIVLLICVGLILYSEIILRAFTPDREVLELGKTVLMIFAFVQIPKALNFVLTGILRGAGELKFIMWNTLAAVVLYQISASATVIFVFHFALSAIWIVQGCDETTRVLINLFKFRNGKWKDPSS